MCFLSETSFSWKGKLKSSTQLLTFQLHIASFAPAPSSCDRTLLLASHMFSLSPRSSRRTQEMRQLQDLGDPIEEATSDAEAEDAGAAGRRHRGWTSPMGSNRMVDTERRRCRSPGRGCTTKW